MTNWNLALASNQYTIIYEFADELQKIDIDVDTILISYDVISLFTNVPLDETI